MELTELRLELGAVALCPHTACRSFTPIMPLRSRRAEKPPSHNTHPPPNVPVLSTVYYRGAATSRLAKLLHIY